MARKGKPARIFAKMNALVEGPLIQELYRASMAGVSIDLCIRGVCCLRPGLPGISENIRVFSIVGRYLEHERVFIFGPHGNESFFLSSADWMPRNLHRRVEILFPVETESLREQIRREVIAPALLDNTRAYDMNVEGEYHRRSCGPNEPAHSAQHLVMEQVARGR